MADIQVSDLAHNTQDYYACQAAAWISSLVGYCFYIRSDDFANSSLWYVKTTDGGQTWGAAVKVNTVAAALNKAMSYAIWYDYWTPGDSGTKIHIAWSDNTAAGSRQAVKYRALDTSNDSLGSEVSVHADTGSTAALGKTTLTKARGGNLYIRWAANGVSYFYRSVDGGATWTGRTEAGTTNPSYLLSLSPGNEADSQDIYGIGIISTTLMLKAYDDSANTWSSTNAETAVSWPTEDVRMTPRRSDSHSLAIYRKYNGVNYDLRMIDVSAALTFTQLTNIYTNESIHSVQGVNVLVGPTGDIYAGYTGVQGVDASAKAYRKSTDGGVSWGSEVRLDEGTYGKGMYIALSAGPLTGRLYGIWRSGVNVDFWGNYGSSVLLGAKKIAGLHPAFDLMMG